MARKIDKKISKASVVNVNEDSGESREIPGR